MGTDEGNFGFVYSPQKLTFVSRAIGLSYINLRIPYANHILQPHYLTQTRKMPIDSTKGYWIPAMILLEASRIYCLWFRRVLSVITNIPEGTSPSFGAVIRYYFLAEYCIRVLLFLMEMCGSILLFFLFKINIWRVIWCEDCECVLSEIHDF